MRNGTVRNFIVTLIAFIILGLSLSPAYADSSPDDRREEFRNLLKTTDGIIRSLRLGNGEVAENRLQILEDDYRSVFSSVSGGNGLHDEIISLFDRLKNSPELNIEDVKTLREKIEELGESEGMGPSFVYDHAMFVILGVSSVLAFTVNFISRTVVDWEKLNRVKRKQSELQDELKKARKEKDPKKMHKLQRKQQQFMQEHMGTMFSPMKTMLIIIIPFIIVFRVLSSTYGGWAVAWLPFNLPWPDIDFFLVSRFFKGTAASLGFFGWYLLSYFGLSQIMRKILVPSQ